MKSLARETKRLLDKERRITHREKINLKEPCKNILLPFLDNEVRHIFGLVYGEIDISREVVDVSIERIDELADREKGLDAALRAVKGCIMHTIKKAKEVLAAGTLPYQGSLTLKKAEIPLEAFDEDQENWSSAMKALMRDNENKLELYYHQKQKTDITTLYVMIGRDMISSAILPCLNTSYITYMTKHKGTFVDIIKCRNDLRDYKAAIDEILNEEDLDTRKALKVELDKNAIIPEIKKRKRATPTLAEDSPFLTKRLMTKRETELHENRKRG